MDTQRRDHVTPSALDRPEAELTLIKEKDNIIEKTKRAEHKFTYLTKNSTTSTSTSRGSQLEV